ncbi:UNKNOWN [Stylonychia lemnae]|uniref:Tetraspanin family protein n=1 Tax=Stylonychia lemnae TaxID=5949 RepID=A0A078B213_STYLE|nr:UNKNOWN [Stylonychia lemnae]|eukprot:CDW87388.1 UNKNOWN [Stylonychia lemnae]
MDIKKDLLTSSGIILLLLWMTVLIGIQSWRQYQRYFIRSWSQIIYTLALMQKAQTEINHQCMTFNSMFDKIDKLYYVANTILCSYVCQCKAEWQNYVEQFPQKQNTQLGIIDKQSMVISNDGAINFQTCPLPILRAFEQSLSKYYQDSIDHNIDLLEALEFDFNCASMCKQSRFWTFSNVTQGPPHQNCATSFNRVIEKATHQTIRWSTILGLLLIMIITNQLIIICQDPRDQYIEFLEIHEELVHPLIIK